MKWRCSLELLDNWFTSQVFKKTHSQLYGEHLTTFEKVICPFSDSYGWIFSRLQSHWTWTISTGRLGSSTHRLFQEQHSQLRRDHLQIYGFRGSPLQHYSEYAGESLKLYFFGKAQRRSLGKAGIQNAILMTTITEYSCWLWIYGY